MSSDKYAALPEWVADARFYQIFPDRFARHTEGGAGLEAPGAESLEAWNEAPTVHGYKGGTLRGITGRLDYLTDLGINALYLNPIFASPANHRYHTQDYFRIDPVLGEEGDFDTLLEECHRRGIRVVLDGVFNHVGRGFYQFANILENQADSPYLDWFIINPELLSEGSLHAYPKEREIKKLAAGGDTYDVLGYRAWANLAPLPKLNTDNPEVREFLLQVSEHWIRRGIDGWRLDVPNEIDDPPFWREFRARVRAINPEAYIVGEIWHHAPQWLEGDRFDALMNYPFSRGLLGFFGGEKLDRSFSPGGYPLEKLEAPDLASELLKQLELYRWETNIGQFNLLTSHDTPRLRNLLSGDRGRAALCTLAMVTLPGAPCIYYGEEIGMVGGNDPECRGGFVWEEGRWDRETRELYRRALALRQDHSSLRRGGFGVIDTDDPEVLLFTRWDREELLLTAWNRGEREAEVTVTLAELTTPSRRVAPPELMSPDHAEVRSGGASRGSMLSPVIAVEGANEEVRLDTGLQPIEVSQTDGEGQVILKLPPRSGRLFRLD